MSPRAIWERLACLMGLHSWHYLQSSLRECRRCGRRQELVPDESGWSTGLWATIYPDRE